MLSATATRTPLELLREWLEEDLRDGIPWSPEDFAQRAWLACRECGSHSYLWPILETAGAWRRAYMGERDGALERFDLERLVDDDAGSFRDLAACG